MGYRATSVDDLGDGYGFRKARQELGIEAFGANVMVLPPGFRGFLHWHDRQDELYFVHEGRVRVEVDGDDFELGPGGLLHVESTTPRRVSNASDTDDLVLLVVGAADGHVGRDGHIDDPAEQDRRRRFSGR